MFIGEFMGRTSNWNFRADALQYLDLRDVPTPEFLEKVI
jgi:hypothetical protein